MTNVTGTSAAVQIALAVLGIFLWLIGFMELGALVLGLDAAYLVFSLTVLTGTEQGAREELGKPTGKVGPGLHYTPFLLVKIWRYPLGSQQDELPGEPEQIFREDDKKPVPKGMFPPNRVKFGQPRVKDDPGYDPAIDDRLVGDPYNVAMVAEVPVVVDWEIIDPVAFRRVYRTIENCRKILKDKALGVLNDKFATMTPARALVDLETTSEEVEAELKEQAEKAKGGIKINDAYAKPFIFSHPLNTAVVGVQIADREAEADVRRAEGKRKSMLKTGLARKREGAEDEIDLLPDASTKAWTDAVKELAKTTGTVVIGPGVLPTVDVNRRPSDRESGKRERGKEGGKDDADNS